MLWKQAVTFLLIGFAKCTRQRAHKPDCISELGCAPANEPEEMRMSEQIRYSGRTMYCTSFDRFLGGPINTTTHSVLNQGSKFSVRNFSWRCSLSRLESWVLKRRFVRESIFGCVWTSLLRIADLTPVLLSGFTLDTEAQHFLWDTGEDDTDRHYP